MLNWKEFDKNLHENNFPELESYYQQTRKYFEQLTDKIKSDEISLKFPASCDLENYILNIKFPTYKIRLINCKLNHDEINKILKDSGNYQIYEESGVYEASSFKPVHCITIHCLEDSIYKNKNLASKIKSTSELEKECIFLERWPALGLCNIPIVIDEEEYITGVKIQFFMSCYLR